ncbi:hypothetical protein DMB65_19325 [Flavobacterium cheongpyeongense]|uniref:Uncharacterized protein n=1 Tax=Flavobacterium cheongpyeongense TaxID=2212651 RepID=A0A2V4BKR5_9FLAO|nr:hypothetical protein DMB65_19325 [Flavobacterium cheongpyeongense]
MTLAQKSGIHLVIIFIVVTLPVIVFEFMSAHQYHDFAFIGGITYFIYAFYLVFKIKNEYKKIILSGIWCGLLAFYIGIILIDISACILITLLITNLLFQAFLLIKNIKSKKRRVWMSYLINFIITVILSIFFSFVLLLALAASGMPSNHY